MPGLCSECPEQCPAGLGAVPSEVQGPAGRQGVATSLCQLRTVSVLAGAPARALFLVFCVSQESSELPSEAGHSALLSWCHGSAWNVSFPGITRNNSWFRGVVMVFPKHRQDDNGKANAVSVLGFCFKLWSGTGEVGEAPSSRADVFCHLCV